MHILRRIGPTFLSHARPTSVITTPAAGVSNPDFHICGADGFQVHTGAMMEHLELGNSGKLVRGHDVIPS